jgi:hypothetical protein
MKKINHLLLLAIDCQSMTIGTGVYFNSVKTLLFVFYTGVY